MRPKVLLLVTALAVLLLGALFLFRQGNRASPDLQTSQALAEAGNTEVGVSDSRSKVPEQTNPPGALAARNSVPSDEDSPTAKHTAYVESRVDELMELAMNDDSSSLDTILSELTNRDPEIRKGALEATIQFGSRDAIPKMLDAATQTDDPREKAEIAEAIEFLKMPSLTETLAQTPAVPGSKTKILGSRTRSTNTLKPAPKAGGP
jgi:hypothetical protein